MAISVVSTFDANDPQGLGNSHSLDPSVSADGRYVVFQSYAANLVSGDTNGTADIFLKDTTTGAITRISEDLNGLQGNGDSYQPSLSADGRYVLFQSYADNLVSGDTNGSADIFLKDTVTGVVSLLSTNSSSVQGNSDSYDPSLSADGRYVVFASYASNLVSGDTNGTDDIFLKDTQSGVTTRLSTDSNNLQANSYSYDPALSADGRYVVFRSNASNLVNGDTNGFDDIFIKDTSNGAITRQSTDVNGDQGNALSFDPSLTADGRYLVFTSFATNLVSGDTNGTADIFIKDTTTGAITRVSTDVNGQEGNGGSFEPSLSADGQYVLFQSQASNLVSDDTNGTVDIFIKHTTTGVVTRLSTDANGVQGNGDSQQPALTTDGRFVVFASYATNLISGDTNGFSDVFLVDTLPATAPVVTSPTATNIDSTTATLGGNVTADGGAAITERGVLIAKTSDNNNPQLNGSGVTKISAAGTTGVFTVAALGLDPATSYTYVAFATNSVGTTYTTTDTFTTLGVAPTVNSPTATDITLTTATLGGNVASDGQVAITERGIVYSVTSLNSNPQLGGVDVVHVTAPGTTGTFTIDVSNLPPGTQISYAAYATNAVGTSYSVVGTFTTQPLIAQFSGITVQLLNDVMIVTGTDQDDTIKVESDGNGGFIVTANKLINGQPSPQSFGSASSFVANTLDGHDDLWLAAPLTFDSVTVDLGNGNDRVILGADPNNPINNNVSDPQFGTLGYLTVNGPVQVTGGQGDDRVIERSTSVAGAKTISLGEGNNEYNVYWSLSHETNYTSGTGADNVYIGYLSSYEASQFDTGAGNDLISYYASRFYKSANLNSGSGYDTVALDVNIYDGIATVDTGSEADYLLFSRSIAYMSVSLTTGGGGDTVLIGKYISSLNSSGGAVYSNGGSNIDQLALYTNQAADAVQIAANVMRLFYADLGDAYDDAEVEYNLFTDGLLDGGIQGARLRQNGNANLRTQNAG